MIAMKIGKTYWALRMPWNRAYFHERHPEPEMKVYPLGFGFRITRQPIVPVFRDPPF